MFVNDRFRQSILAGLRAIQLTGDSRKWRGQGSRELIELEEKLERLGMEAEDFETYLEMFTQNREKHHYILNSSQGWREVKRPWRKTTILEHFAGNKTIGLFPASMVDYLMVDLDCHDASALKSLPARTKAVIQTFDGDPLVYQSSNSGGLRVCYFLERPCSREQLRGWAEAELRSSKIALRPGNLEILANRKGDRLPFGHGSFVVDPFLLEPVFHLTKGEMIRHALLIWKYQKLHIPENVITSFSTVALPGKFGEFNSIVRELLEEGLTEHITTNDALMKLSWHWKITTGCSDEETAKLLKIWVRIKNNGLSTRFNHGKLNDLDRQIERIVRATDRDKAKFGPSKYAKRDKKLSLVDVERILNLTSNPKLQLALFSLLEYCLNFGKLVPDLSVTQRIHLRVKLALMSKSYGAESRGVTYVAEPFFCSIPKETLRRLAGFDKANPSVTLKQIKGLGLLCLKRDYHLDSHRCREYWVHFPFTDLNENETINNNKETIQRVLSLEHAKSLLGEK